MKEQITWQKLKGDTVNGYGVQLTYTFTSFDPKEIGDFELWCNRHIGGGLVLEPIGLKKEVLDPYDYCYQTGKYDDQDCSMCPYSGECSGNEADE